MDVPHLPSGVNLTHICRASHVTYAGWHSRQQGLIGPDQGVGVYACVQDIELKFVIHAVNEGVPTVCQHPRLIVAGRILTYGHSIASSLDYLDAHSIGGPEHDCYLSLSLCVHS